MLGPETYTTWGVALRRADARAIATGIRQAVRREIRNGLIGVRWFWVVRNIGD